MTNKAIVTTKQVSATSAGGSGKTENQEQRARRLFDEMARNIGREAVNHLKTMFPDHLTEHARQSKSWENSLVGHIRNDVNWRMRPLLMAMIVMHREWDEERTGDAE
jgi:hypothetical protein